METKNISASSLAATLHAHYLFLLSLAKTHPDLPALRTELSARISSEIENCQDAEFSGFLQSFEEVFRKDLSR